LAVAVLAVLAVLHIQHLMDKTLSFLLLRLLLAVLVVGQEIMALLVVLAVAVLVVLYQSEQVVLEHLAKVMLVAVMEANLVAHSPLVQGAVQALLEGLQFLAVQNLMAVQEFAQQFLAQEFFMVVAVVLAMVVEMHPVD
jgi:hypothetical protein